MGNQASGETPPDNQASSHLSSSSTAQHHQGSSSHSHLFVFAGFDAAPAREARPVFSALMAQASAAREKSTFSSARKVRLFVAAESEDWLWERNALVKDVYPFLRRFSRVLGIELEVVDREWNMPESNGHVDHERTQRLLNECLDTSFGPSFICFLGDKYGPTLLPTTLPTPDFEHILQTLTDPDAKDLLTTWYKLDTNPSTSVYRLEPVDSSTREYWSMIRMRLVQALMEGVEGLEREGSVYRLVHASATEFAVMLAKKGKAGNNGALGESLYCFQRNFINPPTSTSPTPLDLQYFDNPLTTTTSIDISHSKTRLAAHMYPAQRSYSVPWITNPTNPDLSVGFSPSTEKSHAAYLKTFCDDVARIVAEGLLRQYVAETDRMEEGKHGVLEVELESQRVAREAVVQGFVGREDVVAQLVKFVEDSEAKESVCVVYGPAGCGKSAILAKLVQVLPTLQQPLVISRRVGVTDASSRIHSLLSLICREMAAVYGQEEVNARISEEVEALEGMGDAVLQDELGELLDHWPPTSMAGLKLAVRIGMGLASSEVPLVLIIDGLYDLTNETDATTIDWLPAILPPNIKLILTAQPVNKQQSLFLTLCGKYPAVVPATLHPQDASSLALTNALYIEVPVFSEEEVDTCLRTWSESSGRVLTADQKMIVSSKSKASRMPLYIHLLWHTVASQWTSRTSISIAKEEVRSETVQGLVDDLLERVERRLGPVFVGKVCAYLAVARNGLGVGEVTDVVSLDGEVLGEVFKNGEPAVWRVNSVMVEQVLYELRACLMVKNVNGVDAYFWSNALFRNVVAERYLFGDRLASIHRSLANYWRDKPIKEQPALPTTVNGGTLTTTTATTTPISTKSTPHKSYGFNQTLLILGKPNARRISSVVFHLLNSGSVGAMDAVKMLQNISFLGAAIDAGMLDEVVECFKFALENLGASVYSAQLAEYYRFLIVNYNVLSRTPRHLIPMAANLYSTSLISGDVRSWIKSRAPDLNWAEWVNRPASRGEPVALLRPSDATQELTITSRDTFSNLVAVAGIRNTDGASCVSLYEVHAGRGSGAVLPGGRGRMVGTAVVNVEVEEEGMPLVCCFSRTGKGMVVAARTVVFLNTRSLETVGRAVDPGLPGEDLITAVAWTKDDGCVVTASDGSEPGRIVLWDALSFSLLRVIKSQYPRQPICTAFSTIGFWDEYRHLFILLDVDELASDAESGLFLQYIPTKSHTDPPADGCARFALAHKSPLVLVATDEGTGYTVIDYRAKKAVGRVEMDVDTVRSVSISSDGMRVAVVPQEGKVIHVLGVDAGAAGKEEEGGEVFVPTFAYMGTILGGMEVDRPGCLFSRNRMSVLTDGEVGETQVWSLNDLGDHSTVRYSSLLPALSQAVTPVMAGGGASIGWAVTENWTDVSLSDSKGKSKVRSYEVSVEGASDKFSDPKPAFFKDVVVSIDGHPTKPFTVVLTDQGYLSVLYNDSISSERGWIKGLWKSKKVEDGLIATYNLCRDPKITSPTSVAFVKANVAAGQPQAVNGVPVDYLSFVTGHEDGGVFLWDWSTLAEDIVQVQSIQLGYGRISELVTAGAALSKSVAVVVDDRTVVLWDGVSSDAGSALVVVPPGNMPVGGSERSSQAGPIHQVRRSSSSVWSTTGIYDQNMARSTVVAFSNHSDQILATGEPDGYVNVWFLETLKKRALVTHPERRSSGSSTFPILAMGWSVDDGAIACLSEDKRVTIHGVESGELLWIHDLWMVAPLLKVASFVGGSRQLSCVDVYGTFTLVNLHGKWPSPKTAAANKTRLGAFKNAITSSATKIGQMITASGDVEDFHPVATAGLNLEVHELESFTLLPWDTTIATQLKQNRVESHSRSSDQWQYTTGSGSHGHVALLRLDTGLPRGTFEVFCEMEIPESFASRRVANQTGLHLKFVCGITEARVQEYRNAADAELEVVRGFTRFVPVEEQKQLAGMGRVNLRLGFIKTLCSINTCYIDLKRVPGEGEIFKLGSVHFVPADPTLYTPYYQYPLEMKPAFDFIASKFKDFEVRHRRRSSILNSVISDRMSSAASVPDLKAAFSKASSEYGGDADPVEEKDADLPIPNAPRAIQVAETATTPAEVKMASRFSMLPKNVTNAVSSLGTMLVGGGGDQARSVPNGAPKSFADIQREMDAIRAKANAAAREQEEEEERMMVQAQKEREARAVREEFAARAKESIANMVKGPTVAPQPRKLVESFVTSPVEVQMESMEYSSDSGSLLEELARFESELGGELANGEVIEGEFTAVDEGNGEVIQAVDLMEATSLAPPLQEESRIEDEEEFVEIVAVHLEEPSLFVSAGDYLEAESAPALLSRSSFLEDGSSSNEVVGDGPLVEELEEETAKRDVVEEPEAQPTSIVVREEEFLEDAAVDVEEPSSVVSEVESAPFSLPRSSFLEDVPSRDEFVGDESLMEEAEEETATRDVAEDVVEEPEVQPTSIVAREEEFVEDAAVDVEEPEVQPTSIVAREEEFVEDAAVDVEEPFVSAGDSLEAESTPVLLPRSSFLEDVPSRDEVVGDEPLMVELEETATHDVAGDVDEEPEIQPASLIAAEDAFSVQATGGSFEIEEEEEAETVDEGEFVTAAALDEYRFVEADEVDQVSEFGSGDVEAQEVAELEAELEAVEQPESRPISIAFQVDDVEVEPVTESLASGADESEPPLELEPFAELDSNVQPESHPISVVSSKLVEVQERVVSVISVAASAAAEEPAESVDIVDSEIESVADDTKNESDLLFAPIEAVPAAEDVEEFADQDLDEFEPEYQPASVVAQARVVSLEPSPLRARSVTPVVKEAIELVANGFTVPLAKRDSLSVSEAIALPVIASVVKSVALLSTQHAQCYSYLCNHAIEGSCYSYNHIHEVTVGVVSETLREESAVPSNLTAGSNDQTLDLKQVLGQLGEVSEQEKLGEFRMDDFLANAFQVDFDADFGEGTV
ncbi:hypothetical protein HDU98_001712 [Podochytrium sp. JEL0797]|nr:hypothetical protein HDU98_001712 [Podochytrium sp. JEL0797]